MGFKKHLDNLKVYETGKPIELVVREFGIKDVIKLGSNENSLGVSKAVIKALKKESKNAFLYPDDSAYELKDALSKKYKVYPKNIILGSGSDQILDLITRSICTSKSRVLMSAATFAMYEIYAKQNEAEIIRTKSGEHNADEFIELAKKHAVDIIFLCLPNNPLGDCLKKDEVVRIIEGVSKNCLVVLDCAYNDYAAFKDKSRQILPNEFISRFENVIYLGTFSKLYGLAGLRVGYGIAREGIIDKLASLRAPFNVNAFGLKAALIALKDSDFVESSLKNNLKEMERFREFAKHNVIRFVESYANFITLYLGENLKDPNGFIPDSSELCGILLKKGIIIRDLKSYNLNAVRITIGTKDQNKAVLKQIAKYLKR